MIQQDKKTTDEFDRFEDSTEAFPIELLQEELLQDTRQKTGDGLAAYIKDVTETVRSGLDQSIAMLTPWFFSSMPNIYYQTTPRAEKVRHLSAIITGHIFESKQTIELWDPNRSKVTFIGPGGDKEVLLNLANKLTSLKIKVGSLYFSNDRQLFLSTFACTDYKSLDLSNPHIKQKSTATKDLLLKNFPQRKSDVEKFLNNLDNEQLMYVTPAKLLDSFAMSCHMLTHEAAHTTLQLSDKSTVAKLSVGIKGMKIGDIIQDIFYFFTRYGFEMGRAYFVNLTEGYPENINILHFIIRQNNNEKIEEDSVPIKSLIKSLRTLGSTDADDYTLLTKEPYNLSINASNFVRSTASWVHIMLSKENPYYYSEYKIQRSFFENKELTLDLVTMFRLKFDPQSDAIKRSKEYETLREKIKTRIDECIDVLDKNIFKESLNFTDHLLKTNYYYSTKTGLAFRVSPEALDKKYYPQKPYGIFFVAGRNYRFFQIRWKDIARGGLRVVMPRSASDYAFALSGLFDEVYGLSYAQQLKNKDIPEGGSKAVLVLKPGEDKGRAVKSAINGFLDLLVLEDESHEQSSKTLVSYFPDEEIIYLGPDENLTNDLIVWITEHAQRRAYKYAKAFISSKPGEGINHKEFGVTSEGLNVFLDSMLKFLGIHPKKQTFTIKMTGGPDGDVAGNELKILHTEYGENARVVAIADGFGAAYDPQGLAWPELLRLVNQEKSIAAFDPKFLSKNPASFVILADTNEHIRRRNELHGATQADVFIPAGGRPYTVNNSNYQKFLNSQGIPTCKAIIEGANIFFTKEARDKLQELGIYIIKDSSANKAGVTCSSFEIIASLTLSGDEFRAIKSEYVRQVIDILKHKAAQEANLLFSEYQRLSRKKNLVELSMDISREINDVTDLLLEEFQSKKGNFLDEPFYKKIILAHCPKILQEQYQKRIFEKLPNAHMIAIISASMASQVIYKEGLGWLESMSPRDRSRAVQAYIKHGETADQLIASVEKSSLEEKDKIVAILKKSAARDLTTFSL